MVMAGTFPGYEQANQRRIGRESVSATLALTTSDTTTPELLYGHAAGGTIFIPAASSITTLTYYAAKDPGGTYLPLQTSAGVAVTQTVAAGRAYDMPAACYGCRGLKIKANAAGTVQISLKG